MIRVGQKLAQVRQKKGLTLKDVEAATKIKSSFLSSIERGEYQDLPSPAYAHGFVKNYAQFLGVPAREIMALFRREFDEKKEFRVLPETISEAREYSSFRFRVRRRIFLVGFFLLLFIGFLLYQFRFSIISPPLDITSPADGKIVAGEVVVAGKTDINAVITINNEPVTVDENGEFAKKISVFPGESVVVIKAKNRVDKQTTVQRKVISKE